MKKIAPFFLPIWLLAASAAAQVRPQKYDPSTCGDSKCVKDSFNEMRLALKDEIKAWSKGELIVNESDYDTLSYNANRFIAKMIDEGWYVHEKWNTNLINYADIIDFSKQDGINACRAAIINMKFLIIDISNDRFPKPADKKRYRKEKSACLNFLSK
jgi:hypothetical protein